MAKICILTSAHSPFDDRIFYREAMSLANSGKHRVVLIAPGDGSCSMRENVEVVTVPHKEGRLARFTQTAVRIVRAALKEKADIYHFHDPDLLPWMTAFAVMGKKVVYDIHEYYGYSIQTAEWIPRRLRKPVARAVDWIEKKANETFSGTVTVNPHMEGLFSGKGSNTVTISNYPLPWFIDQTRADDGVPVPSSILYLGNVNKIRGYEMMYETMKIVHASHPEVVCTILGPLDRSGIDPAVPRIDGGEGEAVGIRCVRTIPFTDVPLHLKRAGVCWLPWQRTQNHEFGTPVKLFEYMASGRPIVASQLEFVSAVIKDVRCGILVTPEDPQAHADALIRLLTHPEEAAAMGARGRQAVLGRYNWQEEEKKLLKFYEMLA